VMDGIEMCKRIRKGFGLTNLPIMFVCGEAEVDLSLNIFKAGATSLHRKPFIREDLLANVKAHLNNKLVEKRLRQVNMHLSELAEVKSRFLANMSHEIRTPINGILGLTQLTLEEEISEDQRGNLELVESSASHLLRVVTDILNLSKIESGKYVSLTAPFKLRQCIESAFDAIEQENAKKQLEMVLSIPNSLPEMVIGDERMLQQILHILLGNAAKFTPDNGLVHLFVEGIREETSNAVEIAFTIADSGIGIPEQMMSAIFDPFRQVDETHSRQYGGTGLGLALTSEYVNLLGGRIWVDSRVGIGSSFHVAVPCEEYFVSADSSSESFPVLAHCPEDKLSILLAEDNKVNQKLAVKVLEKAGHDVVVASDGNEALMRYQSGSFDLILMDIQMPDLNGIEATCEIRKREEESKTRIPIIALTAHAMTGDKEKYLSAGMDGYVSKPFKKDQLFLEIARVLSTESR
ncbi:MAG: response regulator, partial [Bdellovibrionales bacterium]|nr:response regulator [Bdellovibrionales bacterium]